MKKVGRWLFIAGVAAAVLAGLVYDPAWISWALALAGVGVGVLNLKDTGNQKILLSGVALLLTTGALKGVPMIGRDITAVLEYVGTFVSGTLLVIAMKTFYDYGFD